MKTILLPSLFTLHLLALLYTPTTIYAERVYEEVVFTSQACADLGDDFSSEFEVCAVLESCITSPNDYYEDDVYSSNSGYVYSSTSNSGDYDDDDEASGDEEGDDYYINDGDESSGSGSGSGSESLDGTYSFTQELSQLPGHSTSNIKIQQAELGWKLPNSKECLAPGPILRLSRGVNHGLFVKGNDEIPTNLHFHGLHMSGMGNGDDPRRSVQGSENYLIYALDLPSEKHHGGTYWYHTHHMQDSWAQVKKGSFGMIVIDDNGHDVGTTDSNVLDFLHSSESEKILVMDNSKEQGNNYVANGVQLPHHETYSFVKNEWYRMRILAVNTDSHSSQETLQLGDEASCTVHALAYDGIYRFNVPKPQPSNTYTLTSSSRLDVAIQCSSDASITINGQCISTIQIDSSQSSSSKTPFEPNHQSWKSSRLAYTQDLTQQEHDHEWTVQVFETNINDHLDHTQPLCDELGLGFMYGSLEEWTLKGIGAHPFHMHIFPMQIVSGCGPDHEEGEFYDTIIGMDGCKVRLHLIDVHGSAYMHCHIFQHGDMGASGWINVIDHDENMGNMNLSDRRLAGSEDGDDQKGSTCIGTCGHVDEQRPVCHRYMDHKKKKKLRRRRALSGM